MSVHTTWMPLQSLRAVALAPAGWIRFILQACGGNAGIVRSPDSSFPLVGSIAQHLEAVVGHLSVTEVCWAEAIPVQNGWVRPHVEEALADVQVARLTNLLKRVKHALQSDR
jgi:hypothetical protein